MRDYEEVAVSAVKAWLDGTAAGSAGMIAQLRTLETALGLAANTLPDPAEFVAAYVPDDARPIVMVYDLACVPDQPIGGQRNSIARVEVNVACALNGSPGDIPAVEMYGRRWMTAIRQLIATDYQLGDSRITGCLWSDADRAEPFTDKSTTRHMRAMGLVVGVHDQ